MKKHSHFFTDLAAGFFLLGGSLILAQTTTGTEKSPAVTTNAPQVTNSSTGSGNTAESLNSAHATEATQKKHIAGVKYGDRAVAAPGSATDGTPSGMGINEQGVPSKPVAKPNAMAIKENGISSSKPVAKPHQ